MGRGDDGAAHLFGRPAGFLAFPPIDLPHELGDPLVLGVRAHNPAPLHGEAFGGTGENKVDV